MTKLKCIYPFEYFGRAMKVGDEFDVENSRIALVLRHRGVAAKLDEEFEQPRKTRGRYQRRDMRAQA